MLLQYVKPLHFFAQESFLNRYIIAVWTTQSSSIMPASIHSGIYLWLPKVSGVRITPTQPPHEANSAQSPLPSSQLLIIPPIVPSSTKPCTIHKPHKSRTYHHKTKKKTKNSRAEKPPLARQHSHKHLFHLGNLMQQIRDPEVMVLRQSA